MRNGQTWCVERHLWTEQEGENRGRWRVGDGGGASIAVARHVMTNHGEKDVPASASDDSNLASETVSGRGGHGM